MSIPGFAAETSVYKTSNHYRLASRGLMSNGVVPQGCGFLDWLGCAGIISGGAAQACIPHCFDACKQGAAACALCVGQCLPDPFSFCKDCLVNLILDEIDKTPFEGGDSGSGGPIPCCPPKTPFCCGKCEPLPGGKGFSCNGTCAKNRGLCQ